MKTSTRRWLLAAIATTAFVGCKARRMTSQVKEETGEQARLEFEDLVSDGGKEFCGRLNAEATGDYGAIYADASEYLTYAESYRDLALTYFATFRDIYDVVYLELTENQEGPVDFERLKKRLEAYADHNSEVEKQTESVLQAVASCVECTDSGSRASVVAQLSTQLTSLGKLLEIIESCEFSTEKIDAILQSSGPLQLAEGRSRYQRPRSLGGIRLGDGLQKAIQVGSTKRVGLKAELGWHASYKSMIGAEGGAEVEADQKRHSAIISRNGRSRTFKFSYDNMSVDTGSGSSGIDEVVHEGDSRRYGTTQYSKWAKSRLYGPRSVTYAFATRVVEEVSDAFPNEESFLEFTRSGQTSLVKGYVSQGAFHGFGGGEVPDSIVHIEPDGSVSIYREMPFDVGASVARARGVPLRKNEVPTNVIRVNFEVTEGGSYVFKCAEPVPRSTYSFVERGLLGRGRPAPGEPPQATVQPPKTGLFASIVRGFRLGDLVSQVGSFKTAADIVDSHSARNPQSSPPKLRVSGRIAKTYKKIGAKENVSMNELLEVIGDIQGQTDSRALEVFARFGGDMKRNRDVRALYTAYSQAEGAAAVSFNDFADAVGVIQYVRRTSGFIGSYKNGRVGGELCWGENRRHEYGYEPESYLDGVRALGFIGYKVTTKGGKLSLIKSPNPRAKISEDRAEEMADALTDRVVPQMHAAWFPERKGGLVYSYVYLKALLRITKSKLKSDLLAEPELESLSEPQLESLVQIVARQSVNSIIDSQYHFYQVYHD